MRSFNINPCPYLFFAILERTLVGGGHPQLICPLIVKELRNKDERKAWDVFNPTIPDFTSLGDILIFPVQVKQKIAAF